MTPIELSKEDSRGSSDEDKSRGSSKEDRPSSHQGRCPMTSTPYLTSTKIWSRVTEELRP